MAKKEEQISEDAQKKVLHLQVLEGQIQQLQEQLQAVESHLEDLKNTEKALEDLKNLKKDDVILFPFSSGIFVNATIKDASKLLVNVGNEVVVEKDIKGAISLVKENVKQIAKLQEDMMGELLKLGMYHEQLREELQAEIE